MPMQFTPSLRYEHPGLGDDLSPDPFAGAKMSIAKAIGDLLARSYAGHAWHVEVTITDFRKKGGLIKIRLNGIMPANYWYNIRLSDANDAVILHGAGELLERYRLPRSNFSLDHWRNALNAMPFKARLTGRGHVGPLLD